MFLCNLLCLSLSLIWFISWDPRHVPGLSWVLWPPAVSKKSSLHLLITLRTAPSVCCPKLLSLKLSLKPLQARMGSYRDFSNDFLVAGIIFSSSLPLDAGFFFIDKKDKNLHPYMDFRGLNKIIVKHKISPAVSWTLLLIHSRELQLSPSWITVMLITWFICEKEMNERRSSIHPWVTMRSLWCCLDSLVPSHLPALDKQCL